MSSSFSRRRFLAAPAILAASPAVLRSQSPSDTVRVAFVGVGNRGAFLLRHMLQVPGVEVVAVCDVIAERAEAAAARVAEAGGKAAVYTDFRKMLDERKDIEAVVQAVPDHLHRDVNIAILEVGRHLYAEKPLALTVADCKMVRQAANSAKGIMQVGFQLRFDPKIHAAERFIHAGGIGKVLFCQGTRFGGDLPRDIPWYFDRAKSGDIIIDQGIHILDLFTWAIGAHPERAYGAGGTALFVDEPPGRTVMDHYSVIFDYPSSRVSFSHHYFDPPGFSGHSMRVFGTKGAVDLQNAVWQPREQKGPSIQLEVENAGKDSSFLSLAAFIDNVRANRKPPINDVDSAYISTVVPIMATRSIYERRIVTWEEVAG